MVLGCTLWTTDRSHIGVIDVSSTIINEHTRHKLHLDSRGKKKLGNLTADRITCGPEPGMIPVISGVISRPFLD